MRSALFLLSILASVSATETETTTVPDRNVKIQLRGSEICLAIDSYTPPIVHSTLPLVCDVAPVWTIHTVHPDKDTRNVTMHVQPENKALLMMDADTAGIWRPGQRSIKEDADRGWILRDDGRISSMYQKPHSLIPPMEICITFINGTDPAVAPRECGKGVDDAEGSLKQTWDVVDVVV